MNDMDQEFLKEITRTASPAERIRAQHILADSGRKGLLSAVFIGPKNDPRPGHLAWLNASLGDREKTLQYLNRALQEKGDGAFFLPYINVDPLYDFLRDDPRFKEILHKMELS